MVVKFFVANPIVNIVILLVMKTSYILEKDAYLIVAQLMAAAARTAPKTRGIDNIKVIAIDDSSTKNRLIKKMKELSGLEKRPSFERDANSITASAMIIVIGVKLNPARLDCGFCGYKTCEGLRKTRGVCAYNSIDLGIAASSAASIANTFHIDNRIMYSIGKVCLCLKLFDKGVGIALGIPLSVTGKSPFFDRK